jgi:hypothetical protein
MKNDDVIEDRPKKIDEGSAEDDDARTQARCDWELS